MGGFELCRRLRAMPGTSHSLIVALTRYSEYGIEKSVKDAGFDHYPLKPVSIEVIISLLDASPSDYTRTPRPAENSML
jgi:CheY-like chemotaxis protein